MKKTNRILVLDGRPLQSIIFNGVTTVTKNWYKQILKTNQGNFDQIIFWTNSQKKSPNIDADFLNSLKTLAPNFNHIHTKIPNILLSLAWKFCEFPCLEKILKINPNSKVIYYSGDIRAIQLKQTTKSHIYIHDLFFTEPKNDLSIKAKIHFWLTNYKNLSTKITQIHTNSKFSQSQIAKFYKINPAKIQITTPSLDLILYKPNLKIKIKDQFICIGAFQERKNINLVVKSFIQFKSNPNAQNCKLILVGNFDPAFQKLTLKNHPDIIFKIQVPETEKIRLIQESIALIYISKQEGFGLPILEAITLNRPVIASKLNVFKQNFGKYPEYLNKREDLNQKLQKLHSIFLSKSK
jgi:glycosyltransferase involved in cell wall biosynthesis